MEDLTKSPGFSPAPARPAPTVRPWPTFSGGNQNGGYHDDNGDYHGGGGWGGGSGRPDYGDGGDECRGARYGSLRPPRIRVNRVEKTGNFFSNDYRAKVSIEGQCITEVTLYEDGRRKKDFRGEIPTKRSFNIYDISVRFSGDPDDYPELRVYDATGGSDYIRLDDEIRQ